MATVNERIQFLENEVKSLRNQLANFTQNLQGTNRASQTSKVSASPLKSLTGASIESGTIPVNGGSLAWNDTELAFPAYGVLPSIPSQTTKVFNVHSHNRYNGGALINNLVEVVEYDLTGVTNIYSPGFWKPMPPIAKEKNSNGEQVNKIGKLSLSFDPDTQTWGANALYLDVKKCYLAEFDSNGDIVLDSNGNQKKSTLFQEDTTKTSVIWDENAQVWRFLAVYAESN